jgi:hypothetical protein
MNLKYCYKILEIQETASLPEIKQAYRDMIGIWHPDRYVQNPRLHNKATEKLKELNLAYNELVTRLTSAIVKSDSEPSDTSKKSHLIIVTCPGCRKKNRIKAGFVERHPRCGACGVLLFQKKQTRRKHHKTDEDNFSPGPSRAKDSTDQTAGEKTFGGQYPFNEAPVSQNPKLQRKRRFWNKWTILLSLTCIGMVIANTDDIRHKLTEGLKQISGGRYAHYFKNPSQARLSKKKSTTSSADVLQLQQLLQSLGYSSDPLDGIWKEQTLVAVKQFRDDYFLEFRADDVTEITKALQRQRSIINLHPDWPQTARGNHFKSWIEQQVMTSPKICRELLASGEIQQVNSLLGWYKFDRLQPKQLPMPRNGTLKKGYHKGLAPLTIQTRNEGRHYYLKLLNVSNGSEILSAFLRGGSTFVEHVPVGKYELKYAVGDTWYGTRWLFGPKTIFMKMDQVFDFKIQNNEIAGYRLDLYLKPVGLGDAKKDYAFDF